MKIFKTINLTLLLYASVGVSQVIPSYLSEVDYSSNIDYTNLTPLSLLHNQVAVDTFGSVNSQASPTNIENIRGARVDGYHQDQNGFKYFSFDTDITLNGEFVSRNDIIMCENASCSEYFLYFGPFFGTTAKTFNINAFTIDPANGNVLFTIDSASYLTPSMPVYPSSIIRYNPAGAVNFSYEATPFADDPTKNIDALSYLPNNNFLYSLENDDKLNLIYLYNTSTSTSEVAYTPLSFNGSTSGRLDITSLMATFNNDIFNDGFE